MTLLYKVIVYLGNVAWVFFLMRDQCLSGMGEVGTSVSRMGVEPWSDVLVRRKGMGEVGTSVSRVGTSAGWYMPSQALADIGWEQAQVPI